ncbi:thioredoxin [Pacificibacter maritimus]|uniref:Thioredoxin n=1 Tax=Pacificibacter maritimus TaxID=762213 RepID=A0A3N4UR01_9RHOB|nr:thioredoxin family protein [Pacificibacter maritimus]RPE71075.1 thioredoxin [Pacificibacter maritimus]
MKRRDFILTSAALVSTSFAATPLVAAVPYVEGLVATELAAGATVFLDFKASWCTTCAAQERVIEKLKAENPAYEKSVVFIDVDWDEFGRSDLVKRLNVPRRSTLIVLKGDAEIGRIVAGTNEAEIKMLMDRALATTLA